MTKSEGVQQSLKLYCLWEKEKTEECIVHRWRFVQKVSEGHCTCIADERIRGIKKPHGSDVIHRIPTCHDDVCHNILNRWIRRFSMLSLKTNRNITVPFRNIYCSLDKHVDYHNTYFIQNWKITEGWKWKSQIFFFFVPSMKLKIILKFITFMVLKASMKSTVKVKKNYCA